MKDIRIFYLLLSFLGNQICPLSFPLTYLVFILPGEYNLAIFMLLMYCFVTYATTFSSFLSFVFCDSIADTPTGLASTVTYVVLSLSKYAMHCAEDNACVRSSNAFCCFSVHSKCVFFFGNSRTGLVIVAKFAMYLLL